MRGVVAGAVVLTLAGCSAGDASNVVAVAAPVVAAASAEPVDGSAGLGDGAFPRLGNGGYDVTKYDLRLSVDPRRRWLAGRATISATATERLASLQLDLSGLRVSGVTVNSHAARHSTAGGKLAISPAAVLPAERPFTVVVSYGGPLRTDQDSVTEPGRGLVRTNSHGDLYVLGAPAAASSWFPVNDHPSDKAVFSLQMSVPQGLAALSNGVPGRRSTTAGRTTWRWTGSEPLAPAQAFFLVGSYRVRTATHAGKPLVTALPAGTARDDPAAVTLARTGEIADWLAKRFGPYPFDAYGGVAVPGVWPGTSPAAQSRPLHAAGLLAGPDGSAVLARALAEQWFGASVTPRTWEDSWLSASFATYAAWLWTDHEGGAAVEAQMRGRYETFPWQAFPAYAPGRAAALTSEMAADRGAMTLHALRRRIGDTAFFGLLRSWTAEHRYGTVSTGDFVAAAERASGRDLSRFFEVWLSGPYRPTY